MGTDNQKQNKKRGATHFFFGALTSPLPERKIERQKSLEVITHERPRPIASNAEDHDGVLQGNGD